MLSPARFLSIALIFIFSIRMAESEQAVTMLLPGSVMERELSAGKKHIYQVGLTQGEYISLTVEQRGIDVIVKLFSTERKLITDYDSFDGLRGIEDLEFVAEAPGAYTLEVQPTRNKDAPAGRYQIKIIEMRAATEKDRLLLKARIAHREAAKLYFQDQLELALPPAQRALEIYEKVLGDHARTAMILEFIGRIWLSKAENVKGEQCLERALRIAERVFAANDLRLALIIKDVGLVNYFTGNYEKAMTLFQRALRIYDSAPGDPLYHKIGHTLECLSMVYANQWGDYANAEAAFKRELAIWADAYGNESTWVLGSLTGLAQVYRISGDYTQAELLLLRAMAIAEKATVEDEPFVNYTLWEIVGVLASLYIDKGDYSRAEALVERHEAIFEKLALAQDYANSAYFDALVTVSQITGNFEKAERLSLRANDITENMYGEENVLTSISLLGLATLYYDHGDYAKAEPLLQRALKISQKALGSENSDIVLILNMLANVHRATGEYTKAEALYKNAVAMAEKLFGPNHPDVAKALNNLATLSAAKADGPAALEFQLRANAIDEHNINLNLNTGSERQKLLYLRTLMDKVSKTISLQLRFAPENSRALEQTVALILQRKGRVQDVIAKNLSTLRRHLSVEDQKLLGQLNATTAQLSRLVLQASLEMPPTEQRIRIKTLEEQTEKLEAEISQRSAGFYQQSQPISFSDIRSAVPENSALIELIVYRPFDSKAKDSKAYGEPHYVVYVIRNRGKAQWKELGVAKPIDNAVDALRQALRDPQRKDVRKLARVVDEKIMEPLRGLIGDAVHLLLSPDGQLNLIPFEALVDEQGHFLIERYSATYLTSGRDLLRLQTTARERKSKPLIIANPSFGEKSAGPVLSAGTRKSVTVTRELSEAYFAPLRGTAREAEPSVPTLDETRIIG